MNSFPKLNPDVGSLVQMLNNHNWANRGISVAFHQVGASVVQIPGFPFNAACASRKLDPQFCPDRYFDAYVQEVEQDLELLTRYMTRTHKTVKHYAIGIWGTMPGMVRYAKVTQ